LRERLFRSREVAESLRDRRTRRRVLLGLRFRERSLFDRDLRVFQLRLRIDFALPR